jgi:transporter family protein
MSWLILSILSAIFIGFYDLAKKAGVKENAVAPVLYFSVLSSSLIWVPLMICSYWIPIVVPWESLRVQILNLDQHLLLFLKSLLVSTSWIFNYFAVKHLPVSISSPIRSTSPLWTILIAVLVIGERPSESQWWGVAIILGAFYAFTFIGKMEGIHFHKDRWVGFMIAATLLSSFSALYDKYLLQSQDLEPATVQCWFTIYLSIILTPFWLLWRNGLIGSNTFEWRWVIPGIGLNLLVADFLYFTALSQEGALISVISPLRRSSILITFFGAMLAWKEQNFRPKLLCILVLLSGVIMLNRR